MNTKPQTDNLPPEIDWDELCLSEAEIWQEDTEYAAKLSRAKKQDGYLHVALLVHGRTMYKEEEIEYITSLKRTDRLDAMREHFNRDKACTVVLRDLGPRIGWVISRVKFTDGLVIS